MNSQAQTKKSAYRAPWAWAALGAVLGVSAIALAVQRKGGVKKPLMESLDDLFRICEADCRDLESRYPQNSMAS